MLNTGRSASSVAAVRPNTYAPCALRSVETPAAVKPAHQWLNGFGISEDQKALRPEVATT